MKDLTNQVFGRLTVKWQVSRPSHIAGTAAYWFCTCLCGGAKVVKASHLRTGNISSCGCFRRDYRRTVFTTHGMHDTPEYKSFDSAKQRCNNPKAPNYPYYGGRGIKFLFDSFEDWFAELGERPEPKELYSVDRFPDNNGNYEVGNVRWATKTEQRLNQRCMEVAA